MSRASPAQYLDTIFIFIVVCVDLTFKTYKYCYKLDSFNVFQSVFEIEFKSRRSFVFVELRQTLLSHMQMKYFLFPNKTLFFPNAVQCKLLFILCTLKLFYPFFVT